MSEQPKSYASYVPDQEPVQLSGSSEVETHLDFHRNITVPRYDKEAVAAGRRAFEQPKPVIEITPEAARIYTATMKTNEVVFERANYSYDVIAKQDDYELAA